MSTYFKGQSNVRLKLETDITLTGYTLLIKYRKPNGTTGSWTATIDPDDASKMYYDITSSATIDQEGTWTFWAHFTSGTTIGIGEIATQKFNTEGY